MVFCNDPNCNRFKRWFIETEASHCCDDFNTLQADDSLCNIFDGDDPDKPSMQVENRDTRPYIYDEHATGEDAF